MWKYTMININSQLRGRKCDVIFRTKSSELISITVTTAKNRHRQYSIPIYRPKPTYELITAWLRKKSSFGQNSRIYYLGLAQIRRGVCQKCISTHIALIRITHIVLYDTSMLAYLS